MTACKGVWLQQFSRSAISQDPEVLSTVRNFIFCHASGYNHLISVLVTTNLRVRPFDQDSRWQVEEAFYYLEDDRDAIRFYQFEGLFRIHPFDSRYCNLHLSRASLMILTVHQTNVGAC